MKLLLFWLMIVVYSSGCCQNKFYYVSPKVISGQTINAATESELYDYIMANFPPSLFIDPEVGISDASGNGVTITTAGSPTLNASGGPNDRAYIALDGVNDVIMSDRVDIGTQAIILKQGATNNQMILNVPTSDTGSGDTPKFFKQGIACRSSAPLVFQMYPDSDGTKQSIRMETGHVAGVWQSLIHRGTNYAYKNGQNGAASNIAAVANTTVTKMFFGAWGYGNGTNINNFNQYDLGLYMCWNAELTNDQLYILNAYIESRSGTYGNRTYLYKADDNVIAEATNPVFNGNSNSGAPQTQSYAGNIIPEGYGYYKAYTKDLYVSSGPDSDYLNWTDGPLVLPSGTSGTWDESGINSCYVFKEGSTYNMLYSGRNASNQFQIGLATSSDPDGTFTKDGGNPVVTISAVNTDTGKSYAYLSAMALVKSGSTYYLFMNASDNVSNSTFADIVMVSGTSLTTLDDATIILSNTDSPIKHYNASHTAFTDPLGYTAQIRFMDFGGVHRKGDKLFALASFAKVSGDEFTEARSRIIFPLIAEDDGNFDFKVICDPVIETGGAGTWNRTQIYDPKIMLEQDGEYLTPNLVNNKLFISCAGLGTTADAVNTSGQTGFYYATNLIKQLLE
jgi:hypothetical protein